MIYSCGSKPAAKPFNNYLFGEADNKDQLGSEPYIPTRAEIVIKAILKAYPDKIEKAEFRNNDWAVLLKGTWYYYSDGKMLPENEFVNTAKYRTYQFYDYPDELPQWTPFSPEEIEEYKNLTNAGSQSTTRRSNFFLDALWQVSSNQIETEKLMDYISFFGKYVKMHKSLIDKLEQIEKQIAAMGRADRQIQAWINSIDIFEGYNWRNIAESQSRSYHSYGIAIDFLPSNLNGKQTYWLWTSQYREDWWNVTYSERYHPPAAVIRLFESYGFIWGGKWDLFDTMHFEYRPEILIINELPPSNL
ncbi:MAG: M15 family metallopeptidase [Treponema sp.]|nr:M15 family metallopeptidase [Treponema sp.]